MNNIATQSMMKTYRHFFALIAFFAMSVFSYTFAQQTGSIADSSDGTVYSSGSFYTNMYVMTGSGIAGDIHFSTNDYSQYDTLSLAINPYGLPLWATNISVYGISGASDQISAADYGAGVLLGNWVLPDNLTYGQLAYYDVTSFLKNNSGLGVAFLLVADETDVFSSSAYNLGNAPFLKYTHPVSALNIGINNDGESFAYDTNSVDPGNGFYSSVAVGSNGNYNLLTFDGLNQTNQGTLTIGNFGSNNLMSFKNSGSFVVQGDTQIGNQGDGNSLLLSGITSANLNTLTIGLQGNSNNLSVQNSLLVVAGDTIVGQGLGVGNSFIGDNSDITFASNLSLGQDLSSNNSIQLLNNCVARVRSALNLSTVNGGGGGLVSLDGQSTLNVTGNINLGYSGDGTGDNVTLAGGSTINGASDLNITGNNNGITVGGGSTISLDGSLGILGNGNNIWIQDYSTLTINDTTGINTSILGTNNGLVADNGSTININSQLQIDGGSNTIAIQHWSGLNIAQGGLTLSGTNNSFYVSGQSTLTSYGNINISGTNNQVSVSSGSSVDVGMNGENFSLGGGGTLSVRDSGTTFVSESGGVIGDTSNGNLLQIVDGGVCNFNGRLVNGNLGSSNTISVGGTGSTLNVTGDLGIGVAAGSEQNTLNINSGASVNVTSTSKGVAIGDSGNNNWLILSDDGTTFTTDGDLFVGKNSSRNTVSVGLGSILSTSYNQYGTVVGFGSNANGNGIVVDGGTWDNDANLIVGMNGSSNAVVISNGGTASVTNNGPYIQVDYQGSTVQIAGTVLGVFQGSEYNQIAVSGGTYNASNTIVGFQGNNNSVTVGQGGQYNDTGLFMIGGASSSNTVAVLGAGSVLNAGELVAGVNGGNNLLTVSDGGIVNTLGNVYGDIVGMTSDNNSINISGAGSRYNSGGDLFLGYGGNFNSINIENGGTFAGSGINYGTIVGFQADSQGNIIASDGGVMGMKGDLVIGYSGHNNYVTLSNGSIYTDDGNGRTISLGMTGLSYSNLLLVDQGSSVNISGDLQVGVGGYNNTVIIQSNSAVSVAGYNNGISIGIGMDASNNQLVVNGSQLTTGMSLIVGDAGSGNSAFVTNQSIVNVGADNQSWNGLTIGNQAGANENIVVVANSTLTNAQDTYIGLGGSSNSLLVDNSTFVSLSDNNGIVIGYNTNANYNAIFVSGSNAVVQNTGGLFVGWNGNGNLLSISNGASVNIQAGAWLGGLVVGVSGNSNSLIVDNAKLNDAGDLYVGGGGNNNLLLLKNGATLTNQTLNYGAGVGVGTNTASNTIVLMNNSSWTANSSVFVGDAGHDNQLQILSGSQVTCNELRVGELAGATNNAVNIDGNNSLLTVNGQFIIGNNGSGIVVVSNNGQIATGDITIAAANGSKGVLVIGGQTHGVLQTGNIIFGAGDANLVFQQADVINFTNHISGNGNLYQSGTGTTILATGNTYSGNTYVTQGELDLLSESALGTSQLVLNGGRVVGNYDINIGYNTDIHGVITAPSLTIVNGANVNASGTFNVSNLNNSGILTPVTAAGTPGSITVNGNYTQTGTLNILVNGTQNSFLGINGNASLNGVLNILPSAGTTLSYGKKITFLYADSITGNFDTINLPNGFRGRLMIEGDPTMSVLLAPTSYSQLGLNSEQKQLGYALDSFIPATSGDALAVSAALDNLGINQYQEAFQAIAPSIYTTLAQSAFNDANVQNNYLMQRVWAARITQSDFVASGLNGNYFVPVEGNGKKSLSTINGNANGENKWSMFYDGNGIFATTPGYNANGGGVETGISYKINPYLNTGLYCGYEGAYNKYTNASTIIDNAVRFGGFFGYGDTNGKGVYAQGLAGGTYHNYQVSRNITFPGISRTANSRVNAPELDAMLQTGYDFKKDNYTFGPYGSLQYSHFAAQGFNETGAGVLNYSSPGWNQNSMVSTLGIQGTYNLKLSKNIIAHPQLNMGWQHEFMQQPYSINGNLQGTPSFPTKSGTVPNNSIFGSVGLGIDFYDRWNVNIGYSVIGGNATQSHNVFLGAGYKF